MKAIWVNKRHVESPLESNIKLVKTYLFIATTPILLSSITINYKNHPFLSTSLEYLGAATCKQVNFVDLSLKSFRSHSEVLSFKRQKYLEPQMTYFTSHLSWVAKHTWLCWNYSLDVIPVVIQLAERIFNSNCNLSSLPWCRKNSLSTYYEYKWW